MKKMLSFFSVLFVTTTLLGQVSFSDVATTSGVAVSYGSSVLGGGVSFADFDGDGWDDITYSSDENSRVYFFKNNNGTFSEVTFTGINHFYKTKQVIWVDYDNDGDKDFFATSSNDVNKFYRNDGNMSFTDISATCGLFTANLFTYGASFGDIDNDGDLDVFISNRGEGASQRNFLYLNDNGTSIDITNSAGIHPVGELSFCAAFFDYDNDGDQDIYVANDKADKMNRFYKNNGDNTFEDVSIATGTGISIDAMSTTIEDYNNDGWLDIYVTNTTAGNYLFKNNGDGTFTNEATASGTEFNSIAWGATFLDADNDSNLDLYVSGMLDGSDPNFISSAFYHSNGDNTFTIPTSIGFMNESRQSYANAIGDYNNDGKPDIIVMNDTEANYLWKNETSNTNNWIKIKLEGTTSNKDGIGNKIEVFANGKSQYRYTLCGEGYLGQNSSYEFVGVSTATNIDYIKVTWNTTGQVETITNIQPNQSIIIQEGNGVLSIDNEGLSTFNIYPNPSVNGVFNIHFSANETHQLSIFDVSGRLLFTRTIINLTDSFSLDTYAKGVYFAKITSEEKSSTVVKLLNN
ncbi:MAG: VCBS repeat-containing protein [Flavobacteriaceae bacterium]|nr:VCBS repeat-containing protein [Flavobacteriaceae bacterium]